MSAIDVRRRVERLETVPSRARHMDPESWTEAEWARFTTDDYTDAELLELAGEAELARAWPTMTDADQEAALQRMRQERPA